VVGLLSCALFIGVVSEEMIIASPTSFTFLMLISLIPVIERKERVKKMIMRRIGYYENPSSTQLLPTSRW